MQVFDPGKLSLHGMCLSLSKRIKSGAQRVAQHILRFIRLHLRSAEDASLAAGR